MRLDEKAKENLEAAERLLPDTTGRDGLLNAAASRTYYAAYLAVADRALRLGVPFTDEGSSYFRHDRLPRDAKYWGILDADDADELELLYSLRIRADYLEEPISADEASLAYDEARRMVDQLLDEAA